MTKKPVTPEKLNRLIRDVNEKEQALFEARKVYDKTNIEKREMTIIRRAEDILTAAQGELRRAREDVARQDAKEVREAARLIQRAPPNLEDFVMMHGISDVATRKMIAGYDRITPEEWIQWDAHMAEWKRKIREGAFDAKVW